VLKMIEHALLKMITDKYFAYIPNVTHQDGSKFLQKYGKKIEKGIMLLVYDFPNMSSR
jgi:hypothetical protein